MFPSLRSLHEVTNCYFSHPLAIKRGDGKSPTYQLSTSISCGFPHIFLWFCSARNFHLHLIFKYIYIYTSHIWLVVSTPLKNMKVSWDDYSQPDIYTDIPIGRPEGHPDSWKRWNMGPSSTWPNRHSLASKCCCNRHGMLNHKKSSCNLLGI